MVTQLLSRALCKSLLIMLICHLRCPFILPFSRSPDTACRERPLSVDGLKITFWWIRTFTTIHGCPWKCLMTLFFLHKITHKLSLTCRDKLFLYTCSLEVQATESPAGSSYQHWSSAKHLVFSHNIKENIQNLRILEHPDNLAVCLFSSRSFRFEGITKESNCDWFSFKTLHYIDSCPFGPPRVEQTQWGRSLSERQYTVYCTVQGLFSFGLRAGTSHFSSSSNTPGGWPLQACPPTPAGSTDPARGADHWCLGSQLAASPALGHWHACALLSWGLTAVQVADVLTCIFSRECRLINTGQAVEVPKRRWWSSPPCNTRMQLREKWKQRARGQCW